MIFAKTPIPNFVHIGPLEAQLFHADGQHTDMRKLIIPFRNFAKAPKMQKKKK
jgi:hypothetical protein